jgi:hypothetical protein
MSLLQFKEIWNLQKEINKFSWDEEEEDNNEFNIKRLKVDALRLYRDIAKLYECFDMYHKNIKDKDLIKIKVFDCFYTTMSIIVPEKEEIPWSLQAQKNRLWDTSHNKQKEKYNIILNIISLNSHMLSFFKPFESFEDYKIYYDSMDDIRNILDELIRLFVVLDFRKKDILNMYKKKYKEIYG